MGRILSALVITLFIAASLTGARASTVPVAVDVETGGIRIAGTDGGSELLAPGMNRMSYFDYPALPYMTLTVLLPQGEHVASWSLEGGEHVELSASVSLAPFRGERLDDGTVAGLEPDAEELVTRGIFPSWKVRHTGTSDYRGFRIASFDVYPVRYDLASGRLTVLEGATLVVETEPDDGAARRTRRHVDGFRRKARRVVSGFVDNPFQASSYIFDDVIVDEGERGFVPSYMPGLDGSAVRYLIITNSAMESEFQRLADWKTRKGVPSVVRTVEWIVQNGRSGADLAETIRNFIIDAYEKWGVEYVLLGGDTDVIPARFAFVTFYSGEFIPTDMYFSCLDGNWNADGDSLWGEAFHSLSDKGDEADLYSEVFVGRMPVTEPAQAGIIIDKTMSYETPSDTLYKEDFLFLAEVIFPSDFEPGVTSIVLDGAEILQSIYDDHFSGNPDVNGSRYYENYYDYPGSLELTVGSAIGAMNAGTNHVMHAGHGYKYNMSVGNGSILNYDAYNLSNGDEIFSMYLMNCTNVAFDTDCLAEYFMLNPSGGAFAITGASRSAFPSASRPYMDHYYELIFNQGVVHLGEAYTRSREPFTGSAGGESADRWTHFIYNYLGDPEVPMFRGTVRTFDVSLPPSLSFGTNTVTIDVGSGGSPFDSAYVCLYKEGDDYQYGYTDPSGQITFEFLCRDEGTVYVTVSGLDHCMFIDSLPVTGEAGPFVRVERTSIDDTMAGNGDMELDSGESVYLRVRLENTGASIADDLWGEITALHPSVDMIDSVRTYPDLAPGGASYGQGLFSFSVDPSVTDETPVEFRIDVHDSTGGLWSETFAYEVRAPELELFVNTLSDSLPFGDGDGTIGSGEQFSLSIGVKNFGTGTAYGLQGKIRAEDSGITVYDSISSYAGLRLLETGYGDGFVLSEANTSSDNHFTFELTDAYGRTFTQRMELRNPGPPHTITLDASVGADQIHITWNPPDSLEKYRYLVYHSLNPGGPYETASADLLFHTLFRDRGLEPSTRYYYLITAVDSCGNQGGTSTEYTVTTSPPQLAGWPNSMGKESASSPKVADVDGDTHPDIVVGAEYIYAWDGLGFELRDGDNQPLTWGIFNTEGDNYTASVALGDLDGVQGAEIVGASWNTREIFVFTFDGSTLPGWPKSVSNVPWASPVIGDFDGDGDNEVVAYDVSGTVYVWHHDGTELLDGDSNPSTTGPFFAAGSASDGWHVSTPALADMDGDGTVEMIVCAPHDSIYCLNSDGSAVPGWPVPIDPSAEIGASPAVGDVDGDGWPEVVVQDRAGWVRCLNHTGTSVPGWPKWISSNAFFLASPALADFTGDGRLEVVVPGMNSMCYFFRYDGTLMPGWPQAYAIEGPTESSPVIADIDADGSLDIILGSEEGRLNAWDMYGEPIPGFPIQLNGFVRGTPVVHDMDFDGDLELISSCWNKNVYIWDLEAEDYYGCAQWNGFHGNRFNSGWKELVAPTDAEVTAWLYELAGGVLRLDWSVAGGGGSRYDLYRSPGGEFELIAADLGVDADGILSYTDRTVEEGLTYTYRLTLSDGTAFAETDAIEIPVARAHLYQNHPNPFNPSTTVAFTVPGGSGSRSRVVLGIYDVRGALVRRLVDGPVAGGRHEVTWDGMNDRGAKVSSGIYFARFQTRDHSSVKKMVLLR